MLIAVERVQILVLPGHGELIALDTVLGKMAVSRTAKIPQDSHETPSSINTFKTLRAKGKAKALFCPKLPPFPKGHWKVPASSISPSSRSEM